MTAEDEQTTAFWTVQEFSKVAGKPWYALQKQTDGGIERQYTGYRHEVKDLADRLKVKPEELEPTTEEEFFRRFDDFLPEGP